MFMPTYYDIQGNTINISKTLKDYSMDALKVNTMDCWEFIKCGRKKDCPAYPDHGDCCIAKTGTLCHDSKELLNKITSCQTCDFYNSEYFNKERAETIIDEFH